MWKYRFKNPRKPLKMSIHLEKKLKETFLKQ